MTQRQSRRSVLRVTAAAVALVSMMVMTAPAEARGGHRLHHASGTHHGQAGASPANDRRHANDTYVNAATQEEDNVSDTKIKSICRGC
jgi:hypothetical protein